MNNTILGIWGAGLSTILAVIKGWEIYQNRFRIKTEFSSGNQEHSIIIANLSSKPIIIAYFELFWIDSQKDQKSIDTGTDEGCNISIPSNGSNTIRFDEQYYFSLRSGSKLYIRLDIIGRKSIKKRLL